MLEPTHAPGVMISSTFYDLRQVRDNLRRFLQDELGYRPLVSEHPSFPVNPTITTIENCKERVERDADVLILIVGGRYGTVDDATSKSVTNLEYLAARQKGIPIYAFIQSGIINVMPVWQSNPRADWSSVVDTPQLFEFVAEIRSVNKVWTQEFHTADDIVSALRLQFAYQHRAGLQLQRRLNSDDHWMTRLHGSTLKIALERPHGWEFMLFGHALTDAVAKERDLRRRYDLGIPLGLGEDVDDPMAWFHRRMADALRAAAGLSHLFQGPLQEALGPPGVSGDPERIVFVAETVGAIYRDVLTWASRTRAANIDSRFDTLKQILSDLVADVIRQVSEFGPHVLNSIREAKQNTTGEPTVLNMTLTLTIPDGAMRRFDDEIARLASL